MPMQKKASNVYSMKPYKGIATKDWLKISGGVMQAAITHENSKKYLLWEMQKDKDKTPVKRSTTIRKGI